MKPYFEEDGIVIYNCDLREILPFLDPVDIICTDPPYSPHVHGKQWIGAALTQDGAKRVSTAHTGLGFDPLTDELRTFVAQQAARLARRWTLAFSDLESAHLWRESFEESGLEYIRTCIFEKIDSAPQFTGDRPANAAEAIVVAHPPGKKKWNGGGRRNVFRYHVNYQRIAKPHPSTKPLPLMRTLLSLFADTGETVLDPFCGSGATLEAAKLTGCKAIGVEIEERWAECAANRMRQGVLSFSDS